MSELISQAEYARRMGWARSYVTQLKQEGRVVMVGNAVDLEASQALYAETSGTRDDMTVHHQDNRQTAANGAGDANSSNMNKDIAREHKIISEARRIAAVADQEELIRDKMAGRLVDIDDVNFALNDYGATLRTLMENLADRLTPVIYPLQTIDEIHAAISDAATEVQNEIAHAMQRRSVEMMAAQP